MNEYMLIYKGGDPEAYANTTHEDMAASIEKWGNWFAELEAEGKLAAGGSPLHSCCGAQRTGQWLQHHKGGFY